ncbi:DUF982 domain-containing protein [Mesorhizobium sp. B2-8-5]|uniref:DUF982 domain-containing protein n=1 Tax=Mesorhizobium sp. B2-8-5 TaxID=2589903 RepID=UPI001D00C503|nr:DUF982 domain-containing protein [Mesorhizobium sp. B2-8-5]UCI28098.1 DUF982 domain-containing protein [Mesorhizobium sp. B2-8-5]
MAPPDCLLAKRLEQQTEEVVNDVGFPEPVKLEFPATSRKVASSFEALECLDQQWPEWAQGRSWRAAERACRDALDGWRSGREAYNAFKKAAKRAGLIPADGHYALRKCRPMRTTGGLRSDATLSGWQ